MQELKKLGIDTFKASMFWHPAFYRNNGMLDYDRYEDIPRIKLENNYNLEYDIPTFTLQDILEILPSYSVTYDKYTNDLDKYEIRVDIPEEQHYITHIARSSKSLLEAAFKMLKWCKQNNYI